MYKKIFHFFDKLEDKVRGKLSRNPLTYALLGGIGIVLFWRGVWHTADSLPILNNSIVSFVLGSIILLITGVFVSAFVGNRLILTGLKGEKKLTERTEEAFETEESKIENIQSTVKKVEEEMEEIQKEIRNHHPKN